MKPERVAQRLTTDQQAALRNAVAGVHLDPHVRDLLTQPGCYWDPFEYCPALLRETWMGGLRPSAQSVTIWGLAVFEKLKPHAFEVPS